MNKVIIVTSLGDIVVQLNADRAPKTVENFLQYVDDGFYTGTLFHRVISNFMIQGGGFKAVGNQSMGEASGERVGVENEGRNGLKNTKYSIAMARTAAPHSATSQFFINTKDNSFLNYPGADGWGYAVFGEVVDGFAIVDAIEQTKTTRIGIHGDVPAEHITIAKIMRWPTKPLYDHKEGDAVRGEGEAPIGDSTRSKIEYAEPEKEQEHASTPQYIPPPN